MGLWSKDFFTSFHRFQCLLITARTHLSRHIRQGCCCVGMLIVHAAITPDGQHHARRHNPTKWVISTSRIDFASKCLGTNRSRRSSRSRTQGSTTRDSGHYPAYRNATREHPRLNSRQMQGWAHGLYGLTPTQLYPDKYAFDHCILVFIANPGL